jgi:hypothetical protein
MKKKIVIFVVGIFVLTNIVSITALSTSLDISKSKISDEKHFPIHIKFQNEPPTMESIDGPTSAKIGQMYMWHFVANDPDSVLVQFFVDWGDERSNPSIWLLGSNGRFDGFLPHTYFSEGSFTITVHAVDWEGATSGNLTWGPVVSPTDTAYIVNPFFSFLQNHQNAFPLLRHLLGY